MNEHLVYGPDVWMTISSSHRMISMKLKTPSRAASTLTIGMVLLVATTIFAQQLAGPQPNDQATTKLVASMIGRYHISQGEIDDAISKKLLDRYLKVLDPQKSYFLKSDVDGFKKYRTDLDDLLKVGNVAFGYNTFDLYLKRLDERIEHAQKLIDAEHDFSIDESIIVDADELDWAESVDELNERWRKRVKLELLNLKLDDKTEPDKAIARLHKRYRTLQRNIRETENSERLETYLSAFTHCFDPHSSYMSPETWEEFQISMRLSLDGIGAALRSEDGLTTVAQIVPGGAAAEDGRLKVGDKITGVEQFADGNMTDIIEMRLNKVVRLIRGKRGTKVRLQIKSEGSDEVKIYELVRQKIELKSSEVKGEIIQTGDRIDGRQARIGVINIPSFYRDFSGAQAGDKNFKSTARDVLKVLVDFRDQGGVDAIVVDLRTNGGGALSEAIEVSGLFIDKGPVVQVKDQNGRIKSHDDLDEGAAYTGPLVVICNRLSASASEIFAGAIKDYGRGIIVGDTTTHGKGTVQNVMPVSRQLFQFLDARKHGHLKLTINQFYRVNGDSTQNQGVRSDVVLPSLIDHADLGESFLENALEFDRVPPAKFKPVNDVSPELISKLQNSNRARVSKSSEFQDLQKEIERYLKRKNRKKVSLNEKVVRKEREEEKKKKKDEDDDKEEDKEKPDDNAEGPIFPDTFYNNEVLEVTLDYITALKNLKTAAK